MLKIYGYGDKVRKQIQENTIELLNKEDFRTSWDMNRPMANLYEEIEKIYEYLDALGKHGLTDEGVFTGSLNHEFNITQADTKIITLYDKRDTNNITSVTKVYSILKPGIAGANYNDPRQQSLIVVHKPNIRLFERQVAELLGLFYHNEKEGVWIKYNPITHTYKCKISKQLLPSELPADFYFGDWEDDLVVGLTSHSLIEAMYNNDDLNAFFVQKLNHNIQELSLEPMFEITTVGIKYWNIKNGEIKLNNTDDGFYIGKFTILNLSTAVITDIDNIHRRYGHNIRLDIYGDDDNSYEINTNGGVVINAKKEIKLSNEISGTDFKITNAGDVGAVGVNNLAFAVAGEFDLTGSNFLLNLNETGDKTEESASAASVIEDNNSLTVGEDNILTTKNNIKTVTLNEIEEINGNSTETVDGIKTSNANNQRINATVDMILAAPNITFDTSANGTITFIGKNQTIEGDTVQLGDNLIELNKNQIDTPAVGTTSGIEINRGTETKAQILFRESDDSWISGLLGDLKAIANREDNSVIVSDGIPSWDDVDKIFKTNAKLVHNRTTGTLTINSDNASTTPPIITNSIAKISNMNVDKVDGVDVDSTGAATGELAIWIDDATIGTSNKLFTTSVVGDSDENIPTEKAVKTYVDTGLSLKANIESPTFTGTVSGITKTMVGLGNVDNTADAVKNVLYAASAETADKIRLVNFHADAVDPTGTTRLNMDGYLYPTRVYNAAWNDIAEFMDSDGDCKPGQVMVRSGDKIIPSYKRGDKLVVGVYSDTFGYALGADNQEKKVPVGLSGRVYVWIKEPVKAGDLLISSDISGFSTVLKDEENGTGKVFAKALSDKFDYKNERIEVIILMA